MSKRFTDSEKWDDPFFAELSNKHKLFWLYLLDKCDHAGIYKVNFKMAEFCIGEKLDPIEILGVFKERIISVNPEKWFVPKFIYFQYGELNEESKVHFSVLKQLQKEGILGYAKGIHTLKDKDKDKDKDKEKEKDIYLDFVKLTKTEHSFLIKDFGLVNVKTYIENLNNYIGAKGNKYKSHYFTLRNWLRRDGKRPIPVEEKPVIPERPEISIEEAKKVRDLVENLAKQKEIK